ncbi:MAG: hypothetical protein M1834_003261 [Cirrosporium novae-zelandiae]|nr:MAG: hypothetical protein M1834_003261 [Cirrosporium novae-zelandiae]
MATTVTVIGVSSTSTLGQTAKTTMIYPSSSVVSSKTLTTSTTSASLTATPNPTPIDSSSRSGSADIGIGIGVGLGAALVLAFCGRMLLSIAYKRADTIVHRIVMASEYSEESSALPTSRTSGQCHSVDAHITTSARPEKQWTAREYANAVDRHAAVSTADSLFPGHNYGNLASYLLQPYQIRAPTIASNEVGSSTIKNSDKFARLYNLKDPGPERAKYLGSVKELIDLPDTTSSEGCLAQLLFLCGHPSPEWLNALGAKYRIDPEYFQRHLDFRSTVGRPDYFPLPSLPCAFPNMIRLPLTSIGCRMTKGRTRDDISQKELDGLRKETLEAMKKYLEKLSQGRESELKLGDSIVRHFSVHDNQHFSFEQDISIYVGKSQKGWIAIVWLDVGSDLGEGPAGPWQPQFLHSDSWAINYFPTIQHRSRIALKQHSRFTPSPKHDIESPSKIQQSASLLPLDYGRKLDAEMMICDAFYLLSDIFRFVAFTEVQFVNMLESKARKELDHTTLVRQDTPTLSNLLYYKQISERHISRLREIVDFIDSRSDLDWPKASKPSHQEIGESTAKSLLKDFRYLLLRTESVATNCDRGMDIVMNNVMIKESQKAILQAERVTKLTQLAFFFIPLSFTTSFFGMNFTQFGNGALLNVWVWFAVSVPILLISLAFMFWDLTTITRFTKSLSLRNQATTDALLQERSLAMPSSTSSV